MKDLTQGNIYKNFFLFSIPIVLSSLLSSAFGVINTSIAGKFLGAEGLAATSIASPYTNVIILICNGYTYGFSVLAGNLFGAKDYERLKRMLYSNVLAVVLGLGVIVGISFVFSTPIFHFLKVEEHIWVASKQYFVLVGVQIIISQAGTMFLYCCHAMGETKFPLLVSFLSTGLTVVGNLLTVAVFSFGVIGLGISTILASCVSLLCYWLRLRKYFCELGVGAKIPRLAFADVKALASYSFPNIVQQVAMGSSALIIAPLRNGLGYLVVAAFSVADRLRGYLQAFYYSSSKTASNYIAQCVGAQKYHKIKKAVFVSILQGFVYFAVLFIPMYLFSDFTCGLFVDRASDPEVFDYLQIYIRFYLPFISLHVFCGIFHSIFRAVKSNMHLIVTSLGGALATILATFLLTSDFGIHGLFAACAIGWGFECLYIVVLLLTGWWLPPALREKVLGAKRKKKIRMEDL